MISCCQLQADNKIRRGGELKNDSIMLEVASDELITKEAYNASCYKNYTTICYKKEKEKTLRNGKKHSILPLNRWKNILMKLC